MNFYFDALYGQSKNLIKMKQQLKFNQNIQGRNVNDSNKRITFDVITGWWLSMEPEDSFFNKLHEIFDTPSIIGKRDRFNLRGDERDRTLGVLLVGR